VGRDPEKKKWEGGAGISLSGRGTGISAGLNSMTGRDGPGKTGCCQHILMACGESRGRLPGGTRFGDDLATRNPSLSGLRGFESYYYRGKARAAGGTRRKEREASKGGG